MLVLVCSFESNMSFFLLATFKILSVFVLGGDVSDQDIPRFVCLAFILWGLLSF